MDKIGPYQILETLHRGPQPLYKAKTKDGLKWRSRWRLSLDSRLKHANASRVKRRRAGSWIIRIWSASSTWVKRTA